MSKLIDYRLYDPTNTFFKSSNNDRAKFTKMFCTNSKNCDLYAKGMCTLNNVFGKYCPYGKKEEIIGNTKRALGFRKFIDDAKEEVKGIKQLDSAVRKMALIGDYIYFPYSDWEKTPNVPESLTKGYFTKNEYIPKEIFTIDFLYGILSSDANNWGTIIQDYRLKTVPLILSHLKEDFYSTYSELIIKYPELLVSLQEENYIGRKAIVKTIKKNVVLPTDKGDFFWDGNKLICQKYSGLFLCFDAKHGKLEIEPTETTSFKITDNSQVDENTKFID